MSGKSKRRALAAPVAATPAPVRRPRVLPVALMLGLSGSHVGAQTVAHANGVALAAINAIANMASQSAEKDHAAQVMQSAIEAVTTIATTSISAQASVDTTRIVHGGEGHGGVTLPAQDEEAPPAEVVDVVVVEAVEAVADDPVAPLAQAAPEGRGEEVPATEAFAESVPPAEALDAVLSALVAAPELPDVSLEAPWLVETVPVSEAVVDETVATEIEEAEEVEAGKVAAWMTGQAAEVDPAEPEAVVAEEVEVFGVVAGLDADVAAEVAEPVSALAPVWVEVPVAVAVPVPVPSGGEPFVPVPDLPALPESAELSELELPERAWVATPAPVDGVGVHIEAHAESHIETHTAESEAPPGGLAEVMAEQREPLVAAQPLPVVELSEAVPVEPVVAQPVAQPGSVAMVVAPAVVEAAVGEAVVVEPVPEVVALSQVAPPVVVSEPVLVSPRPVAQPDTPHARAPAPVEVAALQPAPAAPAPVVPAPVAEPAVVAVAVQRPAVVETAPIAVLTPPLEPGVIAEPAAPPSPPRGVEAAPVVVARVAPGVVAPSPVAAPSAASAPPRAPRYTSPDAVAFNSAMMAFPVDASLFAEGNPVLPGSYRVDVTMNEDWRGKFDVRFENLRPEDSVAQPCFDAGLLDALGVNPEYFDAGYAERLAAGESVCGSLETLVPGASYRFDTGAQQLHVSAPQLVMLRQARGYVDPSRWDAGITAATLGYSYNGWHNRQSGLSTTSHYMGLRGGVNLGAWRFRYRATLTHGNNLGLQYRHDAVYAERALPAITSRVTLGEASTDGRVFDAIGYRGFTLQSDERMQPDSRGGFAPVIRGIAQSNARVTIHQRGMQIFETTVPPGPFEIDDLYASGSGGELLVTITEADGSSHQFTESYSSLPELLRPGVLHYSATLGRYHRADRSFEPYFGQLTARAGFTNTVTVYGGVLFAQSYDAATGGVGLNLPFGALTFDGTYARTFAPGKTYTGSGWRLAYTKQVEATNTNVHLAMLRYQNRGFFEAEAAFDLVERARKGLPLITDYSGNRRAQFNLAVSQSLPQNWGTLSLSGNVQTYWNRPGRDMQYNLGYGRSFGRVGASLSASRSKNTASGRWDNQYMLTFSVPLGSSGGGSGSKNPVHLSGSYARRRDQQSAQTSVSGSLGEQGLVSYSLYGSADKARQSSVMTAGGASVGWTNSVARVGVNASAGSRGTQQVGLNAAGAVVAFRDGIVLAPELGETVGIVQAKNARGATVGNARGVQVNRAGHALVAHLQPYRENDIHIDPKGISTDVELLNTNVKIAPTEGAVVLLKYQTRHGYSVLIMGRRKDEETLPFAAGVFDTEGKNVGYVGQGGQALVRLDATQGSLQVKWGAKPDQQCRFDYDLGENPAAGGAGAGEALRQLEVRCI